MGVPKIIYGEEESRKDSWIRYILNRIKKNENFLCSINGGTGMGKTYSGISIAHKICSVNGREFDIHFIPFSFVELMRLISSGKLKKGSVIVFDEPQIAIGSKDHQSNINKAFHNLASTFRHKNYIMFFCNPYLEDLDKSVRKLFHAQFQIVSKDEKNKLVTIKPYYLQWNSQKDKFYRHFLKIVHKVPGKSRSSVSQLKSWKVEHPPKELVEPYELKKSAFTDSLNAKIEEGLKKLEQDDAKKIEDKHDFVKRLTENQVQAIVLYRKYKQVTKVAKLLGKDIGGMSQTLKSGRKKGWDENNINIYLEKFSIPENRYLL